MNRTFSYKQLAWMCREVDRQKAGPLFVSGMARAIDYILSHESPKEFDISSLRILNSMVVLGESEGFRTTPVTFQNGGGSCSAQQIPHAMTRMMEQFPKLYPQAEYEEEVTIDEWIKHFLWIHPFEDGNGRTATILRNWLMETLDNPTDLPDYGW